MNNSITKYNEGSILYLQDFFISEKFEKSLEEILNIINCQNKYFIINFFRKYRFYGLDNIEEVDKLKIYNFFERLKSYNFKNKVEEQISLNLRNYLSQELAFGNNLIDSIQNYLYDILSQNTKQRLLISRDSVIPSFSDYNLGNIGKIKSITNTGYVYGEKGLSKINPNTFELEYTTGNLGIGNVRKSYYIMIEEIDKRNYEYIFGEYGFAIINSLTLEVKYSSGDLGIGHIYTPTDEYQYQENIFGHLRPFRDEGFISGYYGIVQINKKTGKVLNRVSYLDFMDNKSNDIDDLINVEIERIKILLDGNQIREGQNVDNFLKEILNLEVSIFNGEIDIQTYKQLRLKLIQKYTNILDKLQDYRAPSDDKELTVLANLDFINRHLNGLQDRLIPLFEVKTKQLETTKQKAQRQVVQDQYLKNQIVSKPHEENYYYDDEMQQFITSIEEYFQKENNQEDEEQNIYQRFSPEYLGNGIFIEKDNKILIKFHDNHVLNLSGLNSILSKIHINDIINFIDIENSIVFDGNSFYKIDFNTGNIIKTIKKSELGGKISFLFGHSLITSNYHFRLIGKNIFGILLINPITFEITEKKIFNKYLQNERFNEIFIDRNNMYFDEEGIYFFSRKDRLFQKIIKFEDMDKIIIDEIKSKGDMDIEGKKTMIPYFKSISYKLLGEKVYIVINIRLNNKNYHILFDLEELRQGSIIIHKIVYDNYDRILTKQDILFNGGLVK